LIAATGDGAAKEQELIGAGATFPYPLYSKMFDVYSKEYGVKVKLSSHRLGWRDKAADQ